MIADDLPQQGIGRIDTEKPTSAMSSPKRLEPQNGQIFSLLEELKSAKQEITSQGERMTYLEVALKRERKARENAERRARALSGNRLPNGRSASEAIDQNALETPLDSLDLFEQDLPNGFLENVDDSNTNLVNSRASMETLKDGDRMDPETEEMEVSTSRTQARFDLLLQEMKELKDTAEAYKRRAEESEEAQRRFAAIVEKIRTGHGPAASAASVNSNNSTLVGTGDGIVSPSSKDTTLNINGDDHGLRALSKQKGLFNGNASAGTKLQQELEWTLSDVLQQGKANPDGGGRMAQSAPYVSMIGVVLIGVGLMTWLNGWQPGVNER